MVDAKIGKSGDKVEYRLKGRVECRLKGKVECRFKDRLDAGSKAGLKRCR